MLSKFAVVFGVIILLIGVLGFIPQFNPDGNLFGLFHVNSAHNSVHILTGAVALYAGFTSDYASKLFFRIFGLIYAIVAALGFYYGDQALFGFIANNQAASYLHALIAVISLCLGFCCGGKCCCKIK